MYESSRKENIPNKEFEQKICSLQHFEKACETV